MTIVLGRLIPLHFGFDGFQPPFPESLPVEIILLCSFVQIVDQRRRRDG